MAFTVPNLLEEKFIFFPLCIKELNFSDQFPDKVISDPITWFTKSDLSSVHDRDLKGKSSVPPALHF